MNLSKVRDWLEIVGLFSVVVSLVFVGLQLKQSQDIALATQYQARADYDLELNAMFFEDSGTMRRLGERRRKNFIESLRNFETASAVNPASIEAMSDEELGRYLTGCSVQLEQAENVYYQWRLGLISDDNWSGLRAGLEWQRYRGECRPIYDLAIDRGDFSDEFRELLTSLAPPLLPN